MNRSEKEIINKKRPDLLSDITCDANLLAHCTSSDEFSKADAEHVNSGKTPSERVSILLSILESRLNGFKILVDALQKTEQSGALCHLGFLPAPTRECSRTTSTSSESGGNSRNLDTLVVGDQDCGFREIVRVIESHEAHAVFLQKNWRNVASHLDINHIEIQRFQQDLMYDRKGHVDVFEEMLHIWYNENAEVATLAMLCDIFRKIGSKAIASALKRRFGGA